MASHLDDEEQVENLKRWFSENWVALVSGLAIGFAAIGGWKGWERHQEQRALTASQMYEDLQKALTASRADEARTIGDKLVADYAGTPYATLAALRLARTAVEGRQFDDADARLDWVARNAPDEGLRQLAQLRKARVLWQQNKPDDALKLLDDKPAGPYASLFAELRGDIAYAKNERDRARQSYQAALDAAPEAAANRALLQQKIDDLATEVPATEAPAVADAVKS